MHRFLLHMVSVLILGLTLSLPALSWGTGHEEWQDVAVQHSRPLTAAEEKLLGRHMFSLQWISWEKFGVATVTKEDSGLYIKARQELDGYFISLNGKIMVKNEKEFTVAGELITRVHHLNKGEPCIRNGVFTFKSTGSRKYWRLQEMQNPCNYPVVDYVDVYF